MNDFTFKHRTSIIVIVVAVLVVGGFLIWHAITVQKSSSGNLTPAQIEELVRATTATGPETITEAEKENLISQSSAPEGSSESITPAEKEQLVNAMSASEN